MTTINQTEIKFNNLIKKAEPKIEELKIAQNNKNLSPKERNDAYCRWSSIYRLSVEIGNSIFAYRNYEDYNTNETLDSLNKMINRFAKLIA